SITVNITMTAGNDAAIIDFPMAKSGNVVTGIMQFVDQDNDAGPSMIARVDMGSGLTVASAGRMQIVNLNGSTPTLNPDSIVFDIRGTGSSTLTNSGQIRGGGVLMRSETGNLTIALNNGSVIGASTNSAPPSSVIFSAANGSTLSGNLTIKV